MLEPLIAAQVASVQVEINGPVGIATSALVGAADKVIPTAPEGAVVLVHVATVSVSVVAARSKAKEAHVVT